MVRIIVTKVDVEAAIKVDTHGALDSSRRGLAPITAIPSTACARDGPNRATCDLAHSMIPHITDVDVTYDKIRELVTSCVLLSVLLT